MSQKSLVDYAYEALSACKDPISFMDLWKNTLLLAGLSEEEASSKIGQFYSNLTTDGRFTIISGSKWDLRERHKFKEIDVDTTIYYSEDSEPVTTAEDDLENEDEDSVYSEDGDDESGDSDF